MKHIRNRPDAAWHFDFEVPTSLSDRYGELVSIAGTVSLDTEGKLRAPNDLDIQLELVMDEVGLITEGAGVALDSVAKLVAFYVGKGEETHRRVIDAMATRFGSAPRPALTAIPVENLAFPGMMVEIEGYALADADGKALPRSAGALGSLRCGDWLFVQGGVGAVDDDGDLTRQICDAVQSLHRVLEANQCNEGDLVRVNIYYTPDDEEDDVSTVAAMCAEGFEDPGPVATFVPLPNLGRAGRRVEIDAIAMPGSHGRSPSRTELSVPTPWSWMDISLVQAMRCGDAIFIGGQLAFDESLHIIHPGDMVAQTRLVMDRIVNILGAFGATYDDVMKVGCWYNGGASVDTLKRNALIRSGYMTKPGATSTGVPVRTCHSAGMEIQVDIVAMAAPGTTVR